MSARITDKVEIYARDPAALANMVVRLAGEKDLLRLRVGDFRVIFAESTDEIVVLDIGPRGSVYE